MPSGRVRVAPPPARTGTGTGGGTGSGSVSSGGYDRYIGTIGLTADAPSGRIKPHHTNFPAADSGDWVRVVSETTIDNAKLMIGQNWQCTKNGTIASKSANWELIQTALKISQYATYASCIGVLKRILDKTKNITVPNNQPFFVPFYSPFGYGVFQDLVANDPQIRIYATDLYNLPLQDVTFDLTVSVQFSFDVSGDRALHLASYSYQPSSNAGVYDKYGTFLENFLIETKHQTATQRTATDIFLHRARVLLRLTDPIDDKPITHSITSSVNQDSGSSLKIEFAELAVIAWK